MIHEIIEHLKTNIKTDIHILSCSDNECELTLSRFSSVDEMIEVIIDRCLKTLPKPIRLHRLTNSIKIDTTHPNNKTHKLQLL